MFSALSVDFLPFLLIPNCHLQTLSVWKSLKFVVWERVKIPSLNYPRKAFENTMVKGGNSHFPWIFSGTDPTI